MSADPVSPAIDSPFSPGSDTVPPVWAGRTAQLSDWRDHLRPRRLTGLHERGRTILGEAGLGESALVHRITSEASATGDWVTPQLRIPTGADPLKRVAAALLTLAEQTGLATAREKKVAEVQNITDDIALSQLLTAPGDALVHEEPVTVPGGRQIDSALPLTVYLTGLPEFADMAGARKGATFARRFQTTMLTPLEDAPSPSTWDMRRARQPARRRSAWIDSAASSRAAGLTRSATEPSRHA